MIIIYVLTREHPFLLAPDARTVGPCSCADTGIENRLPVLWPILCQCCHIMVDIQEATVRGTINNLVEGVCLPGQLAVLNILERHKLRIERVSFIQWNCMREVGIGNQNDYCGALQINWATSATFPTSVKSLLPYVRCASRRNESCSCTASRSGPAPS